MGHFFYFIGKMVVNCVQKDTKKLLTFRMMICIMSKVGHELKLRKERKCANLMKNWKMLTWED